MLSSIIRSYLIQRIKNYALMEEKSLVGKLGLTPTSLLSVLIEKKKVNCNTRQVEIDVKKSKLSQISTKKSNLSLFLSQTVFFVC